MNGKTTVPVLGAIAAFAAIAFWGIEAGRMPDITPVETSVSGIQKLFEAECFDWRSFRWAKRKYLAERSDCKGEITFRSISDCQANVVAVVWNVPAIDAPEQFEVTYFFDETAEPRLSDTYCEIAIPSKFSQDSVAAAKMVAQNHRLLGPFKSDEKGFFRATLRDYWTDNQGKPIIGISDGEGGGIILARYHDAMEYRRPVPVDALRLP